MKLAHLVETSRRVTEASGRLEKIGLIASLLASVPPAEIEIAVGFLSGSIRQSKLGIGYAALQAATPEKPAESPSLELAQVDTVFEQISRVAVGKGST
ncbi:MAG: ligase 1, partial [Gemmatimonadales bacterium]|nr:ligase 1 [Gemmatimonadales bacterium]